MFISVGFISDQIYHQGPYMDAPAATSPNDVGGGGFHDGNIFECQEEQIKLC